MNSRLIFAAVLVAAAVIVSGICLQGRRISALRGEQQQRLAQLQQSMLQTVDTGSQRAESMASVPPELLRLRNEVSRLSARKSEFAGAQAENEKLRAQLSERGTNAPAGARLPPGYIRKSQARFVGYNTPEDTIQSFLWAVQNHDAAGLAQAVVPAASGGSFPIDNPEFFWSRAHDLFGMRVAGQVQRGNEANNGVIELQVELAPGAPLSAIGMKQIAGQWKILWVSF